MEVLRTYPHVVVALLGLPVLLFGVVRLAKALGERRLDNVARGALCIFIGGYVVMVIAPRHYRAAQGNTTGCLNSLKTIGTALELYADEWNDGYPTALSALTPGYLAQVPACPNARQDTYSATYQRSPTGDAFTVCCGGHHHRHAGLPPDHPRWTSREGLRTGDQRPDP
ncbi:MAG: hypothetical protein AB1758_13300 [Candidatus Eremiobacterota bacterium]